MKLLTLFALAAPLFAQQFAATPLIDFQPGQSYLGRFEGYLYDGSNQIPSDHAAAGSAAASAIVPRDLNGVPSSAGKIVFLSSGMSSSALEWCGSSVTANASKCSSASFMSQASGNSLVNRTTLRIANGAISGATIEAWTSPSSKTYSQIASMLSKEGLSEKQVQAIWLKNVTDPNSITAGLPSSSADAYVLERMLATAIRAMKVRYPNLKQVFVTSRRYEGYGCPAPPEPFAYEVGFGIKWLVKAQVDQMRNAGTVVDTAAGDLNYNTVAPWIAYGPYLWASGSTPRSDGLFWVRSDYGAAGCHTSDAGTAKAVNQFMQYFLNSAQTPWFRANY